jgi:Rrf2 family protein
MLTKTSLLAIRALLRLGQKAAGLPVSPRAIAKDLGESPAYMSKVARELVKAGILRARRGAAGGVLLARPPRAVSILAVVEACQGPVLPDFCRPLPALRGTCALHRLGAELHSAVIGVLSGWTLEDFLRHPAPTIDLPPGSPSCLLACPGPPRGPAGPARWRRGGP